MKAEVLKRIRMFGAWCGLAYPIGLLVGWWLLAGFLPAHRPSASAEAIAEIFHENYLRIRIGMMVVMFTAMVIVPFAAVVSQTLSQIEDGPSVLTYSALLGGAATMVLTFYPAIWWLVACFRPERSAELLLLMNDLSWLQFLGGVSIFLPLLGSIMVAALNDGSVTPAFPRWSGFYTLWVMLLILPDQFMFFFHVGPFAWNGLFGLWIPLFAFGSWFVVIFFVLRKHIARSGI